MVMGIAILVTDYNNHRLQKFTLKGQFLAAVGGKPLQFNCPIDITVSPTNDKVYVVDNTRHCILVLNSDLTFSSTFGEYGIDQEHFRYPLGIACDSTGKVLVADSGNNRIQVFTAEGRFLRMFGRHGQGKGELDWPSGVAIDSNNLVYVSEDRNHRVSVFTSEYQFVVVIWKEWVGTRRGIQSSLWSSSG